MKNSSLEPVPGKLRWTFWLILIVGILLWSGLYFLFTPLRQEADFSDLIEEGRQVYVSNCVSCHGAKGVGGNPEFPKGLITGQGTYIAPALNGNNGQALLYTPEQLFRIIQNGSQDQESPMRGFGDQLSSREIQAVVHYIISLWPEKIRKKYQNNLN